MSEGKVAKNTAYLLSAFVGQKILALAYFMVVARLAGVEGTGKYVLATSFAAMFSVFVDLGFGNILVREIAKDHDKARAYLSSTLGIKAVLGVVVFVLIQVAAWLMGYAPDDRVLIAIASFATILESFHVTVYAVLRGFQNLRYEAVGVILGQFLLLVVGTVGFYLWRNPAVLVFALVVAMLWNFGWSAAAIWRRYGILPWPRLDSATVSALRRLAAPFVLAAVFSRTYSYIDQVMLSRYGTAELGLYGAAYKLTFAFIFLPSSFAAALYPAMSEYYVSDRTRLAAVFTGSIKYLAVIALPVSFGIAALAEPVITMVYGAPFSAAAAPLRVLVFALPFSFMYWATGSFLNATGRQAQNTWALAAAVVVNLVANLLLLPNYGMMGAAVAATMSGVILFAAAFVPACRIVPFDGKKLARGLGAALFAASFMGLSVSWSYPFVGLLPSVAVGVVLYPLVLLGIGGLTWAEAKGLVDLFLKRRSSV